MTEREKQIINESIAELETIMEVSLGQMAKDLVKSALGRSVRTKDPMFWPAGMLLLGLAEARKRAASGGEEGLVNRIDEALTDFNNAIPLATERNYYNLVGVAKYYIGLCLFSLGHEDLGMEKLREASETAHEQHCCDVAMHTEAFRAMKMLEKGRADVALEILKGWAEEFKMML